MNRVLIVEDEPALADSIRYGLEREGYECTVLSDGRVCGTWVIDDDRATAEATLRVAHVGALSPQARQELTVEGLHFVRFMRAEAAGHDVRLVRGT
jgi:DNA-binding response OmpR family regulator